MVKTLLTFNSKTINYRSEYPINLFYVNLDTMPVHFLYIKCKIKNLIKKYKDR